MASGRLPQGQLEDLANTLSLLIVACDRGMTPEAIRGRLLDSGITPEDAEAWVECARALHEGLEETQAPARVKDPSYRKGTGRKPAKWANCLWRPQP